MLTELELSLGLILSLILNAGIGAGFGGAAGLTQWLLYRDRNPKANGLIGSNTLAGAAVGLGYIPTMLLIEMLLDWLGEPNIITLVGLALLAAAILGAIYGTISGLTNSTWVTPPSSSFLGSDQFRLPR